MMAFGQQPNKKTLSQKLVELRRTKGLTQDELAKLLNTSRGAVSMWEIGQRVPDRPILAKIADLFNVSVDYLLGRTDDPRCGTRIRT